MGFPPVDNVSDSAEVMYHSLPAEALFWWFLYWQTGEMVPVPQNLPVSFKKMHGKCWNKRKVN